MDLKPSTPAKIYSMSYDVYNKATAKDSMDIKVLIQEANQWTRGGNVQTLDSDSIAVITPADYETLTGMVGEGRVEGMIMHIDPFSDYTWYRIDSVAVGRDLLLNNKIKHYELSLSRSTKLAEA